MPLVYHATSVQWQGRGLLIKGASGSGKSDLAVELIDAGAVLIADDLVEVSEVDEGLWARALETGQGLIELRGQGIFEIPWLKGCLLHLAIELVDKDELTRLPEQEQLLVGSSALPICRLQRGASSNVARIRMAMTAKRVA